MGKVILIYVVYILTILSVAAYSAMRIDDALTEAGGARAVVVEAGKQIKGVLDDIRED